MSDMIWSYLLHLHGDVTQNILLFGLNVYCIRARSEHLNNSEGHEINCIL